MPEAPRQLPPAVRARLIDLFDGPDDAFAGGVDELCATHATLASAIRAEAASILRTADRWTESAQSAAAPTQEPMPTRIGPFRIRGEIGHGGMGTVYLAERTDIKQRVAVKVINLGMNTKAVLARFDAERAALARMEHTHIAKVLDAGATDRGQPWFAMEFVKGERITRYCDKHKLSVEDRLRLFQQVCSGVQHAHTKGVVHRDLTPSNILVTVQDGQAKVTIIDFGLAKATDRGLTEQSLFTEHGMILGTPEYMAPEQAGVGALDIDTRADIYTLGVLLYELLVGALPFNRDELRAAGWEQMCSTIREKDPPRPSTKITGQSSTQTVARARRTDASTLRRRLRGDLDWVVIKCLEKDRTRRYETAAELSADVQRHLAHEPVLARAPSAMYRLRKFVRRYRAEVVTAGLAIAAVMGSLVSTTTFWLEARNQAAEAKRQESIAQAQAQAAEKARAGEARKAEESAANAAAAERNAEDALTSKHEFEQLAGVVLYERAIASEKFLYPAWPAKVEAMQRWLADDAGPLLALQPQIDKTLADLRLRALPATREELERDRATHPRLSQWRSQATKLGALTRAHAIRAGTMELTTPLPSAAEKALTATSLNELAWPLADNERAGVAQRLG